MTIPILHADTGDLEAASETLAAAFEDYAWTRYVIPTTDYAARLLTLQRLYLDYAHQHGIVGVTATGDGVIALIPPTAPAPEEHTVEQIIALHGDRLDRLSQSEPPAGAWRLETLGVRPEQQGQGRASALLAFGVDAVRARGGSTIALETSDRRNVRLYERYGFSITESAESTSRPPVWKMTASLQ
ncbi:GNAT family N-acetyltransferase [Leucobacter sp. USHLN154]|uniref:GNAT family N-acetyltransferase n=1 Tax=Leucobacter sp. USHLN154 TaxID=3081269 RepID=UPI0030167A43